MIKPNKYFRKQADKAEQAADRTGDAELAADLRAMAKAYRSQADALKRKQKGEKKKAPD